MKRVVNSRWFALFDLGCVLISCTLWFFFPQLHWRPLVLALFPWLLRVTAGRFPFKRTVFDIPLVIFLFTTSVGVWAAYNQEAAWAKFWILISSVLLYYALVYQREANLWVFVGILNIAGACLAAYYLLTNDWQTQNTGISLISQLGQWWMAIRPSIQALPVHHNNAASLLVILAPFTIAGAIACWRKRNYIYFGGFLISAGIVFASLLMTASRGAAISLGLVLGISLVWGLSDPLARRLSWQRGIVFIGLLLPFILLGGWFLSGFPGGMLRLLDNLPGPASASSRVEIERNTLLLLADFPYTGGGLRSFPGLYSQYILVIPYYFIEYSHNIFLEVALEQGIFGLFALIVIVAGSFWLLGSSLKSRSNIMGWAALASLAIMCLHGLVTDAIYGQSGSPFVFFQAALAVALTPASLMKNAISVEKKQETRGKGWDQRTARKMFMGVGVSSLLIVAFLLGYRQPLLAAWYANLGAVKMARVQLADFPTGKWEDSNQVPSLTKAEVLFRQALLLNPENRTANYRLGLIAFLNQDFSAAVKHLEVSSRGLFPHRGIQKALGYNYAWTGQYEKAVECLSDIPEAAQEMSYYTRWWGTQGREDLASKAERMTALLTNDF